MLSVISATASSLSSSIERSSDCQHRLALFVRRCSSGVNDAINGLEVRLTDGSAVFAQDQVLCAATHRPQSRRNEDADVYINAVYLALTAPDSRYHFDVQGLWDHADSVQLIVKETVEHTTTQTMLIRIQFHRISSLSSPASAVMDLFADIQSICQQQSNATARLTAENAMLRGLNEQLGNDLQSLSTQKDALQDVMIRRMCLVLNAKKVEIQRLHDCIAELESSVVARPTASAAAGVVPTTKRVATRGKAASTSISAVVNKKRTATKSKKLAPKEEDSVGMLDDEVEHDSESSNVDSDNLYDSNAEDRLGQQNKRLRGSSLQSRKEDAQSLSLFTQPQHSQPLGSSISQTLHVDGGDILGFLSSSQRYAAPVVSQASAAAPVTAITGLSTSSASLALPNYPPLVSQLTVSSIGSVAAATTAAVSDPLASSTTTSESLSSSTPTVPAPTALTSSLVPQPPPAAAEGAKKKKKSERFYGSSDDEDMPFSSTNFM